MEEEREKMFVRLDHVQLAMPAGGEAEARAFYAEVLGFSEVEKPQLLKARGGCWFELGEIVVHLGVEKDFRPAKKAHPAFEVEDLPALAERLESQNISLTWDDLLAPQLKRFYAHDPFGNRLEFLQRFFVP